MNKNSINEFCELINSVFEYSFEPKNFTVNTNTNLSSLGITYKIYPACSILINNSAPVDKIIMIVQGSVQIHCYNAYGEKSIQGIMYAPDFFGLIEALTDISSYTSSVITNESLGAFSIPISLFKIALNDNLKLANIVIQKIAEFSSLKMQETVEENLYKPIDLLIIYLYKQSKFFNFPYTIEMKRADLADLLHIELRTLYRYLQTLQDSNMCTHRKGKLFITKSNFINLEEHILTLDEIYTVRK